MQVFRLPWQRRTFVPECHFPLQLLFFGVFFFPELCLTSKLWLLRQHLFLKGSDRLCPSVPRQGLFFEDRQSTEREEVLGRLKRYREKQGERKQWC